VPLVRLLFECFDAAEVLERLEVFRALVGETRLRERRLGDGEKQKRRRGEPQPAFRRAVYRESLSAL
jgi:hypothetical protein